MCWLESVSAILRSFPSSREESAHHSPSHSWEHSSLSHRPSLLHTSNEYFQAGWLFALRGWPRSWARSCAASPSAWPTLWGTLLWVKVFTWQPADRPLGTESFTKIGLSLGASPLVGVLATPRLLLHLFFRFSASAFRAHRFLLWCFTILIPMGWSLAKWSCRSLVSYALATAKSHGLGRHRMPGWLNSTHPTTKEGMSTTS